MTSSEPIQADSKRQPTKRLSSEPQFPKQAIHRDPLSSTLVQVLIYNPLQSLASHTIMLCERYDSFCLG